MFAKSLLLALTASVFSYTAANPVKRTTFNNILIVMMEDQDYSLAVADPNLSAFASQGVLYSNWFAAGRPGQPNYVAITSGDTQGLTSDTIVNLNVTNVVDILEPKGLTWKVYAENYPGNCFTGAVSTDNLYYRKHNPFISYVDIQTNPTRCAKIVDGTVFPTDVNAGILPNFAFYIPNIQDDGHDTTLAFGSSWLSSFLSSNNVLTKFDVVLVLYDEGSHTTTSTNQVYAAVAGKAVLTKGKVDNTALTHYSVLATLERNFGLANLGRNDVTATPFSF